MRRLVGRCVLNSSEDKGLLTSQVEGLEGETLENVERLENYGLAGRPPAGSEAVLVSVGGARDHQVLVGGEHREHRPELSGGEIKLYSMFKQFIHLDKDGNIRIKAPKGVIIEAESFSATLEKGVEFQAGEGVEVQAGQGVEVKAGQDVKFESQTFWADAQGDATITAERIGMAAEGGSVVDAGMHFKREVMSDSTMTAQGDITSNSNLNAGGEVAAGGDVRDRKSTMQDMRDTYNRHSHPGVGGTSDRM